MGNQFDSCFTKDDDLGNMFKKRSNSINVSFAKAKLAKNTSSFTYNKQQRKLIDVQQNEIAESSPELKKCIDTIFKNNSIKMVDKPVNNKWGCFLLKIKQLKVPYKSLEFL